MDRFSGRSVRLNYKTFFLQIVNMFTFYTLILGKVASVKDFSELIADSAFEEVNGTLGKEIIRSNRNGNRNESGISTQTTRKRNIAKVNVLVAMLCLDFNWLSKTFEQERKRPWLYLRFLDRNWSWNSNNNKMIVSIWLNSLHGYFFCGVVKTPGI